MSLQRRRDYLKSTIFLSAVVLTSFLHFREEATKKVTRNTTTKTRRKVLLFKLINLSLSPFDELKGEQKRIHGPEINQIGLSGEEAKTSSFVSILTVDLCGWQVTTRNSLGNKSSGWSSSRNENLRS